MPASGSSPAERLCCVLSAKGSKPVLAVFPPKKAIDLNTSVLCF